MTPSVETLEEFARESNAIEGFSFREYGADSRLFRQHVAAAKHVVATHEWDPQRLHFMLLDGTGMLPPDQIGIFRNGQVYVGGHTPPSPGRHLIAHMERWRAFVEKGPASLDEATVWLWTWEVHHHFEAVHPFWDTNGRTGRLILNAARLRYGLDWYTVHTGREQRAYYRQIEEFEQSDRWQCPEKRARQTI